MMLDRIRSPTIDAKVSRGIPFSALLLAATWFPLRSSRGRAASMLLAFQLLTSYPTRPRTGRSSAPHVWSEDALQELARPRRLGIAQHVGRLPLLDHQATFHENDRVGHLAGEAHLVRGDEHGHATLRQVLHD